VSYKSGSFSNSLYDSMDLYLTKPMHYHLFYWIQLRTWQVIHFLQMISCTLKSLGRRGSTWYVLWYHWQFWFWFWKTVRVGPCRYEELSRFLWTSSYFRFFKFKKKSPTFYFRTNLGRSRNNAYLFPNHK